MAEFNIERTQPITYLDNAGKVINGFQVTVFLSEFNETHLINVSSLNKDEVKKAVTKLLTDRKALSDLSSEE